MILRFLARVTRLDRHIEMEKEQMGEVIECSENSLIFI